MRTHLPSSASGGLGLGLRPGAMAVPSVARVASATRLTPIDLDGALRNAQAATSVLVDGLQVETRPLQACPAAVRCLEFEPRILLLLLLVEVFRVLEGREELLLPLLALGIEREAVAGESPSGEHPVGLGHHHSLVFLRHVSGVGTTHGI